MDEILVHIAAPSTAHDDARYRAQIAAILDFQCASRSQVQFHINNSTPCLPADLQHEPSPIREASRPAFSDHECPAPREVLGATHDHEHGHSTPFESFVSVIPDSQEIAQLVSSHSAEPQAPLTSSPSPYHANNEPTTVQPAAPTCSSRSATAIPVPDSAVSLYLHLHLPLEIHPPSPPIATAPFKTHITPTLSMLAERLKPARTYNPSRQARKLDPLERGYWFVRFTIVDTDADTDIDLQDRDRDPVANPDSDSGPSLFWPAPLFRAFWSFLSEFVGRDGRAGWGVWCILERDVLLSDRVTLKVYAWGEVAMHVYLLLFLASERRIRGMGAQWRDYREEVVVQMP
ncbi:uncharacterized protein N7529_007160 [Penicillium soppii]|jgi:hypothetical protein|uniref:uncharacterized protein n=1 Tax=Penicillium soppii TaxID=69789 RepID=UPI002546E4C0|nr:uncharacterized protein N7529_007160 [Penicillium soppii]KAJ5865244.1 hypothetical protein N7529_007160 [Penicillium soppii]